MSDGAQARRHSPGFFPSDRQKLRQARAGTEGQVVMVVHLLAVEANAEGVVRVGHLRDLADDLNVQPKWLKARLEAAEDAGLIEWRRASNQHADGHVRVLIDLRGRTRASIAAAPVLPPMPHPNGAEHSGTTPHRVESGERREEEEEEEEHIELRSTACDPTSSPQEHSTVTRENGDGSGEGDRVEYANAIWYAILQRLEEAGEVPRLGKRRKGLANMAWWNSVEVDVFEDACRKVGSWTDDAAEFERELRVALDIDEADYWRDGQFLSPPPLWAG